jgi:uncharacterized protein (DUF305 family)
MPLNGQHSIKEPIVKKTSLLALLLALPVVGLVFAGCGNHDDTSNEATDIAFVTEMAPHHELAIEMAEIARKRADHPEIRQLASDIVETQTEEISMLGQISDRLGGGETHGTLGMSSEEMGMDMDASELKTAHPFDRDFIDMMIPHHQGAILMAREELAGGTDDEAKELAEQIIAAQGSEIDQMNEWREKWFGASSPAGGIPAEGSTMPDEHEGMEH